MWAISVSTYQCKMLLFLLWLLERVDGEMETCARKEQLGY
jgi:hypothetical protein